MRVSVGDVRLYFDVSGAGWAIDRDGIHERPVLIGLHGGPGIDGTKHRYTLASLADTAQVIVPDQRGHGRSDLSDADSRAPSFSGPRSAASSRRSTPRPTPIIRPG